MKHTYYSLDHLEKQFLSSHAGHFNGVVPATLKRNLKISLEGSAAIPTLNLCNEGYGGQTVVTPRKDAGCQ